MTFGEGDAGHRGFAEPRAKLLEERGPLGCRGVTAMLARAPQPGAVESGFDQRPGAQLAATHRNCRACNAGAASRSTCRVGA